MIRLIRDDGIEILLNTDLIKTIEGNEGNTDTIITLTNEEKIVVKNPKRDIIQKIRAYKIGRSETKKNQEIISNNKDKK